MRHFCTPNGKQELSRKAGFSPDSTRIMFLTIFIRVKIGDSGERATGRADAFCGPGHFVSALGGSVRNAETADAKGISSVLVSLDLAIHRL